MLRLLATLSPVALLLVGAVPAGLAAGTASYKLGRYLGYNSGWKGGQTALKAEITKKVEEKQDAATIADDVARQCSLDPDCRVRDDGFLRDDGLKPTR